MVLNEGPFAALDSELHLQVMRLLPLQDKVTCLTAVCKVGARCKLDPSLNEPGLRL